MSEKMKILKMLESGQISAEQAQSLLASLDSGGAPATSHTPAPPASRQHYTHASPPPAHTAHSAPMPNEPHRPRSLTDDIGQKFESFAKDMGPKMHRLTETIADKILSAADKVGTTFAVDAPHGSQTGHTPKTVMPKSYGTKTELVIDLPVDFSAHNELIIAAQNGDMRIKGYNGDKISARIAYRPKSRNAKIDFVRLAGKYTLVYEPGDFDFVSVDAFVPERAFKVVRVDGTNGIADISTIHADSVHIVNANGQVHLAGIAALRLHAENTSGAMSGKNLVADEAKLENLNGPMDFSELDVKNLQVQNFNAPLAIAMSRFDKHSEYTWLLETSNAKLSVSLPTLYGVGYHIKAHAAMGDARLTLVGMDYLANMPGLVEAKSTGYATAAKRLNIRAETSGAAILIG